MKGLTIKELNAICEEQIKMGNGNKEIYIAGDEEGNSFSPLFYAFTHETDRIKMYMDYGAINKSTDANKIVLLG